MKAALAVVLVGLALGAGATASAGRAAGASHGPMLGVVPHVGPSAPRALASTKATATNVQYWGGSVMRTNTTYAVYWIPSGFKVDPSYRTTVDGFLSDVAAASGSSDNVYSVATQYYDTTGPIAYQATFGGSYVDTTPFPASGCNDAYQGVQDPVCLTDDQIRAELGNVIAREGWPVNSSTLFFMITPEHVGTCYTVGSVASGNDCASNSFCAYHDWFYDQNYDQAIYAVQPYVGLIDGCNATPAGAPNGQAADAAINTISHEQNEAITDPYTDGWATAGDQEIADLCAWTFGASIGTTADGQSYNQLINGNPYAVQEEWSNDGSRCLQHYGAHAAPATTAPPVVSGVAAVGHTLSTTRGSWAGGPTAYGYQWQRCAADGSTCNDIAGATGRTYALTTSDAGQTVRSEVRAKNAVGTSPFVASTATAAVVPQPAATVLPAVSGVTAVRKTLSTTAGTWNTPATFAYRWLRCKATGGSCTPISYATSSTYRVRKADAGRRLEARVTATNAAGKTTAFSVLTDVVVGPPTARKTPQIKGSFAVGRRLSATPGAWSGAPAGYTYQWLRCSASGGSCVRIHGATHRTYLLRRADAGHRIRVRVTARNVGGAGRAQSRATRVVPQLAGRHR